MPSEFLFLCDSSVPFRLASRSKGSSTLAIEVPIFVYLSLEPWDDIWRRNQFLCAELARRNPPHIVLFITPARDLSNAVRRRKWHRLRRVRAWSPQGLPNVLVFTPTKWLPNSIGLGRAINAWVLRRQVRAELRRLKMSRPILWINDHAAVHLVGELDAAAVVYDVTDDWTTLNQSAALRARTLAQDATLCEKADAVIVCSPRLLEMKSPMNPRTVLIPNGVDAEHYSAVTDRTLPLPPEAAAWPRPVLGYTGTVHPDRVDVELIRAIAGTVGVGSVVLIGPNHLRHEHLKQLQLANVFMPGPIAYETLPQYMRAFDVCIVPHRVTPFTESLNPIKLWDYLAAGKPIVSTPVAGFRDYPQFVYLADNAAAFVVAAQTAMAEDPELQAQRQSEARNHSWSSRVDSIEKVIEQAITHNKAAPVPERKH